MKITVKLLLLTFLLPLLLYGTRAELQKPPEHLRIGNGSGGSELAVLHRAVLELRQRKENRDIEFSIVKVSPDKALEMLAKGELELAVLELRDIPDKWRKQSEALAAEALVCYTGFGNPLKSISIGQLREIWETPEPVWKPYNGEFNRIHRLGLTRHGGGFAEARFLGGILRQDGVYRSGDIRRAWLFCNPSALLCGHWVVERPAGVMALAVDGVYPTAENIVSGRYPLSLRYHSIAGKNSGRMTGEFIRLLHSPEYAVILRENGLIPMLELEGKDEKKP